MGLNPEQIKMKVADAIANRVSPPEFKTRAKFHLWININTHAIGCNWATAFRPQKHQRIIYTFLRDPNDGFTAHEWNEIAEQFRPYFT